jgi:membrane-bound lytic murein transglycosylase MltF
MEVIMTFIDTDEKLDWLLNALENNEIQIVSGGLTEEEKREISRELAEYRAAHPKAPAKQAVSA